MSVLSKVLFIASGLFVAAGVVAGWVFHVPGGGSRSAWQAANYHSASEVFDRGSFPVEMRAVGTQFLVGAYALLAVGVLLFVIAVIAAFMNLSDQNRKLKAQAAA